MRILFYLKALLFCSLLLTGFATFAQRQSDDAALAKQYLEKGELAKAEEIYKDLISNNERFPQLYPDYLQTLLGLKKYRDAEKLAKKAQKKFPNLPAYEVDMGLVQEAAGNKDN